MSHEPDPIQDPLAWLESRALWQGALFRSLVQETGNADQLQVDTRLGPWQVKALLGAGGMAQVYRAVRADGQFDQTVAIKCVPANPSVRDLELFRRERQILAELNHPNIARLLDGGTLADGRAWLAMELVEGQQIDRHADAEQLGLEARVRLLLQVIAAVAHAHQRLLIHRDIKPSNVLVDAEGRVRLLDFGIAGWVDERVQVRAYSPGWASPEQKAEGLVGPASDQYQLGLLLAKLCAPFLTGAGIRVRELLAIEARACADHPDQRYYAVAELGADLERWLARQPVQAMSRGLGYAAHCAIRRRPISAAVSVVVLVAMLTTVAIFSWRLQKAHDRAERAATIAEQINLFLTRDLLAQADPYNNPDRDLRVRDVLDRARVGIGQRFADQPAIEAGIRSSLADAYTGIGDFPRAREQYQEAIARAESDPEFDIEQLVSLRAAAEAIDSHLGNADQAVAGLKALEVAERQRLGSDSAVQKELALKVLEIQVVRMDSDGALAGITALRKRLGDTEADQLLAERLLALEAEATTRLARFDVATDVANRSYQATIKRYGEDSPLAQLAAQVLVTLARQKGEFKEALTLQEQIAKWYEQRFGRHHHETLRILNEWASILQDNGQRVEAESLFREVLTVREQTLGDRDVQTRTSLNNLGLVLSLQNKLDEAEMYYRRALEVERAVAGPDALDVLVLAHNLAGLQRKRGQYAAALALAEDTVARADRTLAEDRYEPALFRVGLAQTLQKLGRYDEAERQFRAARSRLVGVFGADHANVAKVDSMLNVLAAERASQH